MVAELVLRGNPKVLAVISLGLWLGLRRLRSTFVSFWWPNQNKNHKACTAISSSHCLTWKFKVFFLIGFRFMLEPLIKFSDSDSFAWLEPLISSGCWIFTVILSVSWRTFFLTFFFSTRLRRMPIGWGLKLNFKCCLLRNLFTWVRKLKVIGKQSPDRETTASSHTCLRIQQFQWRSSS